MSRTLLPYQAHDLSALARILKRELDQREKASGTGNPSHVEWLNILVRAVGFRNYQHFKAEAEARGAAGPVPKVEAPPEPAVDMRRVEAAARCFDADGVLTRWPAKTVHQQLCLWRLWSIFPADREMSEKEVNAILKAHHLFGDHALLRREMFNQKLLDRTPDCSVYRRIERRPPPDALAVIRSRT